VASEQADQVVRLGRVRQATATATVDKALRDACGLDLSVLGQTTNLSSSPPTS